jgi:hypothetical protein
MQYGIDTNPSGQNQQIVTNMAAQGDEQTRDGMSLDALGSQSAMMQSTQLNTTGGVLNYDTTPLATSTTKVNTLIKEIHDIVLNGYIGISKDTSDFANGTMLSIYDNMAFNDQLPSVVVTDQPANTQGGGAVSTLDLYSDDWGDMGDLFSSWFDW